MARVAYRHQSTQDGASKRLQAADPHFINLRESESYMWPGEEIEGLHPPQVGKGWCSMEAAELKGIMPPQTCNDAQPMPVGG